MSDNDQRQDLPDNDEHRALREALERQTVASSDSHDSSILLAAQATGRDIRERMPASSPNRMRWQSWVVPIAAAAALVIVAYFVAGPVLAPTVTPDTTVRGTDLKEVIPEHRSTLTDVPRQFQWPAQTGATGYRVTLRDANADKVWATGSLTGNETTLPHDIRTRLEPGTTYLWTVDVEGPAVQATLGPYWFQVAQ